MRRRLASLVVVVILAASSGARAQDDSPPTPNPQALAHFQAGKKFRDDGNCDKAIPALKQSVQIQDSIGGWYNLGYCYDKLENRPEAYRAFKKAAELAKRWKDDRLREITSARESVRDKNPHIKLVITPQPLPTGTEIVVDGASVKQEDFGPEVTVFTDASAKHEVIVRAPGFHDEKRTVAASEPTGITLVRVKENGGPQPPPDEGWTGRHWLGLGLFSGGVLAGVLAGVLYAGHRSRLDTIDGEVKPGKDKCASANPDVNSAARKNCDSAVVNTHNDDTTKENTRAIVVVGGVGAVAVALLVSGSIIFLTAGPQASAPTSSAQLKTKPTVRVLPDVGPTSTGLSFVGTF
jgi:hypothetical protein